MILKHLVHLSDQCISVKPILMVENDAQKYNSLFEKVEVVEHWQ